VWSAAGSRYAGLNRLGFITVPGHMRKIRNSLAKGAVVSRREAAEAHTAGPARFGSR